MAFPSTIKAIGLTQTGDFDVIKKIDLPFPKPNGDQLLIRVEYSGINFIDNYFRTGIYPVAEWPYILGQESSGTIAALPTDPAALNDPDYKKMNFSVGQKVIIKEKAQMAEYAVCRWQRAIPLPETISLQDAAAIPAQLYTALTFAEEAYNIKQGDFVFIHTVAGGFGLNLTQIAKLRGATVIGSTSTQEKAAIAKEYGADHVILYKDEDVVKRVLEITDGQGVHASFDGVGKDGAEVDFQIIRRKGTIVFVGNASGPVAPIAPLRLAPKNIIICRPVVDNYMTTHAEYLYYAQKANELVSQGHVKIRFHAVVPFTAEAVQQAERELVAGKTVGKIVVKVADGQ
ncbi:NAD(P)-binding protein [Cristinia sonorae]|uniref:NAD(P)-binding protein n=1 Tax=Cristinia sonorae TaxID=1940300 RepID=A0A8K0XL72_9AGAR|nr:NAD(P)-binding protein [Cristinia sonorae]